MHPKAVRLTKVFGALALVGGLASSAIAQDPVVLPDGNLTFAISSAEAAPGQTVELLVSVSGGVAQSSALNFTVEILEGGTLVDGNITGAGLIDGYAYEDNTTTSGQYRGVLYPAPGSNPPPFSTTDSVDVARLSIKVSDSATEGTIRLGIANRFDTDGITGLVGLSNSQGSTVINAAETVAAGGTRAINSTPGTITIVDFTTVEFNKDTFNAGWEAVQILPGFRTYLPDASGDAPANLTFAHTANTGVVQTTANLSGSSYGYFGTLPANRITSAAANNLLIQNWTVTSSAADPNDAPKIRMCSNADGWAEGTVLQEVIQASNPAGQGQSTVPVAADGATVLQHISFAVPSASNGGQFAERDGFLLNMDFETFLDGGFKFGGQNETVVVQQAELRTFDPSTLTGGTVLYDETFTGGATGGFVTSNPGSDNVGVAGLPMAADSSNGLLLTPSGAPSAQGLSFGWFENTPAGLTVDGSLIYRVEYNLSTTAASPVQTNPARLRIAVEEQPTLPDYVKEAVVESGGSATDTGNLPSTDAAGTDYVTYVRFPAKLNGQQIKLYFDVFQTVAEISGLPVSGGVKLNSLTITSFPAPSILD